MEAKRRKEGVFYLVVAGAIILLVMYHITTVQIFEWSIVTKKHFRISEKGRTCDDKASSSDGNCNPQFSTNKYRFSNTHREHSPSSSSFVLLLLVKNQSNSEILRIIKNVIKISEGIPVVVLLNGKNINEHLKSLPVHYVLRSKSFGSDSSFASIKKRIFSNSIADIFNLRPKIDECPKMPYKHTVNILTTQEKTQDFYTFTFSTKDELEQEKLSFGDSEFHPYWKKSKMDEDTKKTNVTCDDVIAFKRSLKYIKENFKNFDYLIVLDSEKHFTPNIISYFKNISKVFDIDPSIYCISAHNPLMMEKGNPSEEELSLVDHFVYGGATLFSRKLMEEILNNYQIQQKLTLENSVGYIEPMDEIEKWLSWWSVRRLRSCVVPAKPRVCQHVEQCSRNLSTAFEVDSLIRYRYFIQLFNLLEGVRPLLYEELPCQNNTKPTLDRFKNETSFGVFVKMISKDDNLALHFIFKCFGIEHRVAIGSFENLYKFYWKSDAVYVIGVPYSNFGPSIKKEAKLYMLQTNPEFGEDLESVLKAKDYAVQDTNLTTVSFEFKDDDVDKNMTSQQ